MGRTFAQAEFRRLRSMPRTLWLILLAGVAFLIANIVTLLSIGVKIDPGTATLFGAFLGLSVVAWQTNRGFQNLIRSQENASRLEREARFHRYELERKADQDKENRERRLLLAGLRGEIVSLHNIADASATTQRQFAIMYKLMHENNAPAMLKEFVVNGYKTPFYKEQISKLGLLGVSLAADVIKVYSMAFDDRKVVWENPAPNAVVSVAYATGCVLASTFREDLFHVAMRIRADEEGTPDPGTLHQTQAERHKSVPSMEDMVPKKMY